MHVTDCCLLVCLDEFQLSGTNHSFVYVYEPSFCKTTDNIKLDISLCQFEGRILFLYCNKAVCILRCVYA